MSVFRQADKINLFVKNANKKKHNLKLLQTFLTEDCEGTSYGLQVKQSPKLTILIISSFRVVNN